jgi:hypothetical protein
VFANIFVSASRASFWHLCSSMFTALTFSFA